MLRPTCIYDFAGMIKRNSRGVILILMILQNGLRNCLVVLNSKITSITDSKSTNYIQSCLILTFNFITFWEGNRLAQIVGWLLRNYKAYIYKTYIHIKQAAGWASLVSRTCFAAVRSKPFKSGVTARAHLPHIRLTRHIDRSLWPPTWSNVD